MGRGVGGPGPAIESGELEVGSARKTRVDARGGQVFEQGAGLARREQVEVGERREETSEDGRALGGLRGASGVFEGLADDLGRDRESICRGRRRDQEAERGDL